MELKLRRCVVVHVVSLPARPHGCSISTRTWRGMEVGTAGMECLAASPVLIPALSFCFNNVLRGFQAC